MFDRDLAKGFLAGIAASILASTQSLAGPAVRTIGSEFLASTNTDKHRAQLVATTLSNGRFVFVWAEQPVGSPYGIKARLFGPRGQAVGNVISVSRRRSQNQSGPGVDRLGRGGFVVGWRRDTIGESTSAYAPQFSSATRKVQAQRFDGAGQKLGRTINVGTGNHPDQFSRLYNAVSVTTLPGGGYALLWDEWYAGGLRANVDARMYAKNGTPLGREFTLSQEWPDGVFVLPDSTLLSGGKLAASLSAAAASVGPGPGVLARVTDPGNSPTGKLYQVSQDVPANGPARLASLPNNRYVAVWRSSDSDGGGIVGQIMAAGGKKIGSPFLVNTTEEGNQLFPRVASFVDGYFVVVWADGSQSSDDPIALVVRGQLFNARGKKIGDEFLVAAARDENKERPEVAAFDGKKFVVGWLADDSDRVRVRGQLFRRLR